MKRNSLHPLHALFTGPRAADGDPVPDGVLLERWVQGDSAAFELIVFRHADAVFGTCARVCGDAHDVEDAFQATFLVLARKATSVRRPICLAGWLHRVAHRVATRAAVRRAKTQRREQSIVTDPPARTMTSESTDLQAVLDAEINRLADRYRLPVLLCYLHGLSTDAAAKRLGIPRGTVLSRLATARQKLAVRLTRRGVTVSVTAAGLFGIGAVPSASAALVTSVARVATHPLPSTTAAMLAREIIHMTAWKSTFVCATVVAMIVGLGAGVWVLTTNGDVQPADGSRTPDGSQPVPFAFKPEEDPPPLEKKDLIALFQDEAKKVVAKAKVTPEAHRAYLLEGIADTKKLRAERIDFKVALNRVTGALTGKERERFILFGSLDDLRGKGQCWEVITNGGIKNELFGYLDLKTGKLLFLWESPEG